MARDFTKNTANFLSLAAGTLGAKLNGASAITIACWARWETVPGAGSGSNSDVMFIPVNAATAGLSIHINPDIGSGARLVVGARSVSSDSFQSKFSSTAIAANTTYHVGGVINVGADTITPYLNGAAEGGGSVTFGNATYTNGTPTAIEGIGCATSGSAPISTSRQLDGMLAEICFWNVALTASEMAILAAGYSPLMVRPQSLMAYYPLHTNSDWVGGATLTTTGTVSVIDHPRIIYPRRRSDIWVPAAASLPTLSASTYVTGSLTSTGWRPQITAS